MKFVSLIWYQDHQDRLLAMNENGDIYELHMRTGDRPYWSFLTNGPSPPIGSHTS